MSDSQSDQQSVDAVQQDDPRSPRWSSRGYLPHCEVEGRVQAITFRLHDSVPVDVIEAWRSELRLRATADGIDHSDRALRQRIERYADAGHGVCWLKRPDIATIVEDALLHGDGTRYRLIAWCLMPNHVHCLIDPNPDWRIATIVHSWKSFSATMCNRALGRTGMFWMRDYFDRFVRDQDHLYAVIRYIENNPVSAGLCRTPKSWAWSSARLRPNERREG